MKKTILIFVLLFVIVSTGHSQFDYIETDNLRLVYIGGLHSFLAPYTARCFENSLSFHKELWNYTPSEKITVILHDLGDFGNAGASTVPNNRISFAIAPLNYVYETAPANERINATMNHEMVHIVAGDQASGGDSFYRSLMGGKVKANSEHPLTIIYSYLSSPRRSAPVWYHEGIAVFLETWMTGGLRRSLGPYDEMVFRTMVLDSSYFYDHVGLESEGTKVDFHAGVNSYLYGNRFYSYLALTYGPEAVMRWVTRVNGTNSYFVSQFKKTFGESIKTIWSDWIEWEHEFQKQNIEAIAGYPTTAFRPVSQRALGSVSRIYYSPSNKKLYAGVYYPGEAPHLAAIDIETGKIEKITNVKGAALFFVTSLAYDESTETMFYTTDNNSWRDIMMLDLKTSKSKRVQKDTRIGDLAFNRADKSLWGIRHFNGISTLVKIIPPYDEWDQIASWPYGRDLYDIDISPDGKKLSASLAEISGKQTLILFDVDKLEAGDTSFTTLFNFGNSIPGNFSFSNDNHYLFGSSYYTGVSNIYRYDLEIDSMEAITNGITGFFRPVQISEDSLIAFNYGTEGFSPVMIANTTTEDINPIKYLGQEIVKQHPIVKDWKIQSPREIYLDTLIIDSGHYNGLANMSLNTFYPIVEGYKNYTAVGMHFDFSEPIGFHRAELSTSYTPSVQVPDDEKLHVSFDYNYLDWHLNFKYNDADFYDLFGPTKTSRKGYAISLSYKKSLFYDPPRIFNLSGSISKYWNLIRMPQYQNVQTSYDNFLNLNLRFTYHNMDASIGAVDYESGILFQVISTNNYVNGYLFPQVTGNLNLGFPLPIHHTSFWLRTSTGYAHGGRFEPFANFFFGGFGNNWVDHSSEKRYRSRSSFPGVEINEIGGTNYTKVTAELTLPPLRFKKFGSSSFYLTWIRAAVFSSGIVTNFDEPLYRQRYGTIGAQIDFRMTLLSYLKMTLSVGYAAAFEKDQTKTDEYMVSLKVL